MHYVIVGFGVAGFWALKTLLQEHNELDKLSITIITDELSQTYYKCFLPEYIFSKNAVHDLSACRSLIEENKIDVLWGKTLKSIDPESKTLTISAGEKVKYDKLLLSSGLKCAGKSIVKGHLDGVFRLNNIRDARSIQSHLRGDCKNAVVIGDNIFGFELIRALHAEKKNVTLICENDYVAQNLVDKSVSDLIVSHFPQGVVVSTNSKVEKFIDENNKLVAVELSDGTVMQADFVGVCNPLIPGTSFMPPEYLDENGKIPVSEQMMTDIPNVFAAGDLTSMWNEPLEFSYGWRRALFQGQIAARSMMDIPSWYTLAPSMRIQVFGYPVVLLGRPYSMLQGENVKPLAYCDEKCKIKKEVFLEDGLLVGSVLCGNLDKISILEELILESAMYEPGEIASLIEYLEPYQRTNDNFIERYCPVCKSSIDFSTSAYHGTLFSCPICAEVLRVDATVRYKKDLVVHHAVDKLNKI